MAIREYADDRFAVRALEVLSREVFVEVTPQGGKNSKTEGYWHQLGYDSLSRLAAVLEYGEKRYGPDNWRLDTPELHLQHAIGHILRYLKARRELDGENPSYTPDGKDDELGHAFCRLMFALEVEMQSPEYLEIVRQHNGV